MLQFYQSIPLCILFHHVNVYKQLIEEYIIERILPRATIQIATNLVYVIILWYLIMLMNCNNIVLASIFDFRPG